MARPREFDRDKALHEGMRVFWAKGFSATSTDDLIQAMGIARQSFYNAFGDKRQVYLEALTTYLQSVSAAHLERLNTPVSPLEGIRELLTGLTPEDDGLRSLGCMGICSVGEFGTTDAELSALRNKEARPLAIRLVERIQEGQRSGEIDPTLAPDEAAGFVQVTMNGIQVAARAGARLADLATLASFAVERLKTH